jgi:hypothetical protein
MVGRSTLEQAPRTTTFVKVSDPELDMCRSPDAPAGTLDHVRALIRKLIVNGRNMVSPMRSIAREMEESWPAGEI